MAERDEGASECPIGALGGYDPSGRQNVVATGSCENRTRQATRQDPSGRQERMSWESPSMVSKSHPVKVQLARLLRKESTTSLKWIAARLQMGSWKYVSNFLHARPITQCLNQGFYPCVNSEE